MQDRSKDKNVTEDIFTKLAKCQNFNIENCHVKSCTCHLGEASVVLVVHSLLIKESPGLSVLLAASPRGTTGTPLSAKVGYLACLCRNTQTCSCCLLAFIQARLFFKESYVECHFVFAYIAKLLLYLTGLHLHGVAWPCAVCGLRCLHGQSLTLRAQL